MKFDTTQIYFMPGVCNSYRISKFIEDIAKDSGAETTFISASGSTRVRHHLQMVREF